jgi:hypothetical protein
MAEEMALLVVEAALVTALDTAEVMVEAGAALLVGEGTADVGGTTTDEALMNVLKVESLNGSTSNP